MEAGPVNMERFREQLLVMEDKRTHRILHALMVLFLTLSVLYLGGGDYLLGVPFLLSGILLHVMKGRSYVEFEYAVTGGELDVDLIQAQQRRRRVLSVPVRDIELLTPSDSERYQGVKGGRPVTRLYPKGSGGKEYVLLHKGREYRLKPDEAMLQALSSGNPKNVER